MRKASNCLVAVKVMNSVVIAWARPVRLANLADVIFPLPEEILLLKLLPLEISLRSSDMAANVPPGRISEYLQDVVHVM